MGYRLAFYLAGFFFAIATYVFGTWAYATEMAAVDSRVPKPHFLHAVADVFSAHPFTFIAWILGVSVISVVLGQVFDREVHNRWRAEQMANRDGLTEVYNHRCFQDRLATEIDRANRYARPLSLIMLDLDDFKDFNDRPGHQEGDRLLKWFAKLCERNMRTIDIIARYGGEEFAVIMPETDSRDALVAAERIQKATEAEARETFPDKSKVTVSAGVAGLPEHGKTRHALVLAADTALYYSKGQGKNRCSVYQEEQRKVYCATPERLKALIGGEDLQAIEALSATIDARDHYTSGHSGSVSRYALALAEKLTLPETERESLHVAALLHDIGKIGTPDDILHKPGKLASTEWQVVEQHPSIGSHILQKVQQLATVVPGVRHHHERFDGKGYPNGLLGKSIPLFARIIALADAFDAMISDRPYRPALTIEQALAEISRCAGTQFDPELVSPFVDAIRGLLISDESQAA